MAKRKSLPEAVVGGHVRLPFELLDSAAFMGASHRATALLLELARQLNGRNNGHLQLTTSWLKKRGWGSVDQIQKAKYELIERGLTIQTKQGGLNVGASLYGVTWLQISNFVGLDVSSKDYHPGKWRFMDNFVMPEKIRAQFRGAVQQRRDGSSVPWNSTVPQGGVEDGGPVPSHGAKTAGFGASAVPSHGNNVITITHGLKQQRVPVVGAKGRSGKRVLVEDNKGSAHE